MADWTSYVLPVGDVDDVTVSAEAWSHARNQVARASRNEGIVGAPLDDDDFQLLLEAVGGVGQTKPRSTPARRNHRLQGWRATFIK